MKHRMKLAIVLALIIGAASFITSDRTSLAQNQIRPIADSGVVTIGPNQVLRVTVAAGDLAGEDVRIRFRQTGYEMCQASPKLCISSQTTSNQIVLGPNEAASADFDSNGSVDGADYAAWRTVVLSNRRNVKVTGIVFDTATWRVVSSILMANTEDD